MLECERWGVGTVLPLVLLALAGCGSGAGGRTFRVPSAAMEPTLSVGDSVKADTGAYSSADPKLGDIVLFHPPVGAESASQQCGIERPNLEACPVATKGEADVIFIKRVIAGPGDRLKVIHNHAYVNGQREKETFARTTPCADACNLPKEITIPAGHFFLMGDNRGESADSRHWGPVPKGWILGRVRP
jgi:signal peptidase I